MTIVVGKGDYGIIAEPNLYSSFSLFVFFFIFHDYFFTIVSTLIAVATEFLLVLLLL